MARPIQLNGAIRDPRAELIERLEEAPAEHAEALLATYEVLQGLHDRGVLELLRGALGSSDQVIEIAVDAAKKPQSIRSLRNLVKLANLLGDIEPDRLGQLTKTIPDAINSTKTIEPPGPFQLAWMMLWNKDVRRAIWKGATVLEAVGKNLGGSTATPH
jgi:uncharacterized protein YjgD (DUF1641 family)